MSIEITTEYQDALDLIESGAGFILISGKAGTGKSTFIHHLQQNYRNLVTVAPTGIAALNVHGQTIHSFFRFPPEIMDSSKIQAIFENDLYKAIRVLIIDEISMVRADILDAINQFLKLNRNNFDEPFGGVQVIAVGDLYQLPPISRGDDQTALRRRYESNYFFSSDVFKETKPDFVEFTKVYRQKDESFIRFLNVIREGKRTEKVVQYLNQVCVGRVLNDANIITLACTNDVADEINKQKLNAIDAPLHKFQATISEKFGKEHPAPALLPLKVGAQVMFTKNDPEYRWVNGTIGRVLEIGTNSITVAVDEDGHHARYVVDRVRWERPVHEFDKEKDDVVRKVVGSFVQFPLKLAWAVTIHKAQGQTFEKVIINLGNGAFAPGQVYTALSRCRSMNGISLVRPIRAADIIFDELVATFYAEMAERRVRKPN